MACHFGRLPHEDVFGKSNSPSQFVQQFLKHHSHVGKPTYGSERFHFGFELLHEGVTGSRPVHYLSVEDVAEKWHKDAFAPGQFLAEAVQQDGHNRNFGMAFGDVSDSGF